MNRCFVAALIVTLISIPLASTKRISQDELWLQLRDIAETEEQQGTHMEPLGTSAGQCYCCIGKCKAESTPDKISAAAVRMFRDGLQMEGLDASEEYCKQCHWYRSYQNISSEIVSSMGCIGGSSSVLPFRSDPLVHPSIIDDPSDPNPANKFCNPFFFDTMAKVSGKEALFQQMRDEEAVEKGKLQGAKTSAISKVESPKISTGQCYCCIGKCKAESTPDKISAAAVRMFRDGFQMEGLDASEEYCKQCHWYRSYENISFDDPKSIVPSEIVSTMGCIGGSSSVLPFRSDPLVHPSIIDDPSDPSPANKFCNPFFFDTMEKMSGKEQIFQRMRFEEAAEKLGPKIASIAKVKAEALEKGKLQGAETSAISKVESPEISTGQCYCCIGKCKAESTPDKISAAAVRMFRDGLQMEGLEASEEYCKQCHWYRRYENISFDELPSEIVSSMGCIGGSSSVLPFRSDPLVHPSIIDDPSDPNPANKFCNPFFFDEMEKMSGKEKLFQRMRFEEAAEKLGPKIASIAKVKAGASPK